MSVNEKTAISGGWSFSLMGSSSFCWN